MVAGNRTIDEATASTTCIMISLRQMIADDVSSVVAIQDECYVTDAIESEAAIRARLEVAPSCAWVAEDMRGVCAYLVGYPSELVDHPDEFTGILPI
ncbi:MAG TPA: hypothetical protein VEC35_03575 [Noviherbaspirillum sp.]|nr:hypothetical protein [Noviherbaspirillum sp.]